MKIDYTPEDIDHIHELLEDCPEDVQDYVDFLEKMINVSAKALNNLKELNNL